MRRPRLFSLEEANALVPELSKVVGHQLELQAEVDKRYGSLVERLGATPKSLDVASGDAPDVRAMKQDLVAQIRVIQRGWEPIAELGAIVKDPKIGLIDFYGQLDGRLVWLCWRYGEDKVSYFHELDQGFAGRKPIPSDLQRRLLN